MRKTFSSAPEGWWCCCFLLFVLAIVPIYSNTLNASWQFDDRPNIVNNQVLHIKALNAESFRQVVAGSQKRFLTNLSFALNWYFSGKNVLGYHLINVTFHIATAFVLCAVLFTLFQTPVLKGRYSRDGVVFISFFSALLWAVNPVQTQAVTYIVQRSAVMAAFFYLSGMFFYLQGRLNKGRRRILYFLPVIMSFFCALLSKENAVMLPASLLLAELIFFSSHRENGATTRFFILWAGVIGAAGLIGLIFIKDGHFLFFLDGYAHRNFTLTQRLLTEPRIVLFYLSLLFYPLPSRLSVAHDVTLSTSLFAPWTTITAIGLVLVALFLSWRFRKKMPLLSFALLFFFVNHAVESTIIPLELIFEHRNYLPSLFLFLPVAAVTWRLAEDYMDKRKALAGGILACLLLVAVGFGRFTYDRNRVWQSSRTLWLDALSKNRHNARAMASIAIHLGWGKDANPETDRLAMGLFQATLEQHQHRTKLEADIYGNMAGLFYRWGNDTRAIELYRLGLTVNPHFLKNRYDLIKPLVRLGRWDDALAQAKQLVDHPRKTKNPDHYNVYGFLLLQQNRPEEALYWFQQALFADPYNFPNILINTGCALSRTGHYDRAEWFYKYWFYKGRKKYPPEVVSFFLLIENSERAGNREQALLYAKNLLAAFDVISVFKALKNIDNQHETVPMDKSLIAPVIKSAFYGFGKEAMEKRIF